MSFERLVPAFRFPINNIQLNHRLFLKNRLITSGGGGGFFPQKFFFPPGAKNSGGRGGGPNCRCGTCL